MHKPTRDCGADGVGYEKKVYVADRERVSDTSIASLDAHCKKKKRT
jgi:hypothetical protein